MTRGLIQPKETVLAGVRSGLVVLPGQDAPEPVKAKETLKVRLPSEAGIEAIKPPPPPPKKIPNPRIPRKMRYVITPAQLLEMGFTRQELQHIKNEVRSQ